MVWDGTSGDAEKLCEGGESKSCNFTTIQKKISCSLQRSHLGRFQIDYLGFFIKIMLAKMKHCIEMRLRACV